MNDLSLNHLFGPNELTRTGLKPPPSTEETQARRAAIEFEALLLTQLTAALNPAEGDDENSLFGGGGDASMYRQMFSEQFAQAMAASGGVGVADFLIEQLQAKQPLHLNGQNAEATRAAATAKLLQSLHSSSSAERQSPASLHPVEAQPGRQRLFAEANKPETVLRRVADTESLTRPVTENFTSLAPEAVTTAPATRPRRVFPAAEPSVPSVSNTVPRANSDDWRMPVDGRVRSIFGLRLDPIHGLRRFHRGVDIAAPRGTPIAAAADGQVVFAGRQRGYGNTVIIEHADGRQSRYAHADRLLVSPGETVRGGQNIATVGSTGRSTGPHLHFEVSENGHPVNPLNIFANGSTLARR